MRGTIEHVIASFVVGCGTIDYVIASDPKGSVAIYKSNTTVTVLVQTATSLALLAVT